MDVHICPFSPGFSRLLPLLLWLDLSDKHHAQATYLGEEETAYQRFQGARLPKEGLGADSDACFVPWDPGLYHQDGEEAPRPAHLGSFGLHPDPLLP